MILCIEQVAVRYRGIRCNHIAQGLADVLRQAETNEVSYLAFAEALVVHEQQQRNQRRIALNQRKAGFPVDKRLSEFDYRHQTTITLDDLLAVTREFINPKASRSGLARCLKRHGLSNLRDLVPQEEGSRDNRTKTFKDYEPGFVHMDVKYLPKMPDEVKHKYLFVAIDRASRWVYLEIRADKTARSATAFLKNLIQKAPFKITKVLTDNGKEFTDRYGATGERKPTGTHPFDQLCASQGVQHRLIRPRRPQTNGMVERFNGRVKQIITQTRFSSAKELRETLTRYCRLYNHYIPQKNLGHITPVQALKNRQQKRPQLFVKSVHNFSGLDIYLSTTSGRTRIMSRKRASIVPMSCQGFIPARWTGTALYLMPQPSRIADTLPRKPLISRSTPLSSAATAHTSCPSLAISLSNGPRKLIRDGGKAPTTSTFIAQPSTTYFSSS
jgi:transposase-like protein